MMVGTFMIVNTIKNLKFDTPYTVELQWLKHLRNHEKMFTTGVVGAN